MMDRDEALEKARAVERGELPSGSVILPITGPNSLASTTPVGDHPAPYDGEVRLPEDIPVTTANEIKFEADTDPVARNVHRGQRAGDALRPYAERWDQHEDIGTVLGDLLSDVLHLCDITDIDFDNVLRMARNRYNEEVAGE